MNVIYKEVQHNNYSFSVGKKTWKSIKECCNYYGLEYQSVIQYKSNHQCDAEIAIQHFIDYKKNHYFYFRKKKWNSMKECCDYYDVNYKAFLACKKNWNLPSEEALKKYINMVQDRKFIFQGTTYNSFVECCRAYQVNPVMVDRYRRQKKLMRRRGLIAYLKYKENSSICFGNIVYDTFTECCRCYGLIPGLLSAYAKRNDTSLYSALIHFIILNKIKNPIENRIQKELLMPIKYKGIEYQTTVLCCEVLSIDIETVFQIKGNRTIKSVITELDQKGIHMKRTRDAILEKGFCYRNTFYPNIGICCKILGVNKGYIYNHLGKGETIENILDFLLKNIQSDTCQYKSGYSA